MAFSLSWIRSLSALLLMTLCLPLGAEKVTTGTLEAELLTELRASELGPRTTLSVEVRGTRTGESFAQINPDAPRSPASLMKLFTVGVALEILGPAEVFYTTVESDGVVENETLYGDLLLRGGGDPTLGPRFQEKPAEVTQILNRWVRELRQQGIRRIEGNILGDDTRYANERFSIYWEPREAAQWYSAEVSALTFNDNVIDVQWKAPSDTGARAEYKLIPQTKYMTMASSVRVGPGTEGLARIRYFRFRDGHEIRSRGTLPPSSTKYDFVAVPNPPEYAAALMLEALSRGGVKVTGTALSRRDLEKIDGESTPSLVLLRHASPELSEMLPVILGESQNLHAEILLRETGLALNAPTDFRGSADAVTQWLVRNRLHRTGFLMADGSGLAPINRTTARMVTDFLRLMSTKPYSELWRSSLATPGKRSLRGRMSGSDFAGLVDSVQAKTGYINGAHTLAGYFQTASGQDYTFVILLNDYNPERSLAARDTVDRLLLILQTSPRLP